MSCFSLLGPSQTLMRDLVKRAIFSAAERSPNLSRQCVPKMKRYGARAQYRGPIPATVAGGKGRATLATSNSRSALASSQSEVHLNFCVHFHRFAIQKIRLIFPLLYGIDGRRSQHWMPADQSKVFDGSVFADDRVQDHMSLNASLPRQGRVIRLDTLHQKP